VRATIPILTAVGDAGEDRHSHDRVPQSELLIIQPPLTRRDDQSWVTRIRGDSWRPQPIGRGPQRVSNELPPVPPWQPGGSGVSLGQTANKSF